MHIASEWSTTFVDFFSDLGKQLLVSGHIHIILVYVIQLDSFHALHQKQVDLFWPRRLFIPVGFSSFTPQHPFNVYFSVKMLPECDFTFVCKPYPFYFLLTLFAPIFCFKFPTFVVMCSVPSDFHTFWSSCDHTRFISEWSLQASSDRRCGHSDLLVFLI